ncbi:beta-N-acetylhexosaminidase [Pseudoteredinibacter isoporae]|uniref:Beta-hexosaminidase n=1 Tax=Pseudoteredinibacter isoporae TaxID=570281 RepID=A0A7X0JTU8_9GAMM|nr:beta-N-acetylhexosaminidase [Pseudoteredinibacter isoporae]MBB6521729.1 beta-N-acetylhexosaminidase [Pseudoteredinibacter isoporae]
MTKATMGPGPLMMDVAGLELTQEDVHFLQKPCVGGLILFKRNYADRAQLCRLVESIREQRPDIIIAVDQEGGRVQRLQEDGFNRLPPMQRLRDRARSSDNIEQEAEQLAYLMASEVMACGIDISFAPVLDVDDCFSSIIGDRSFSDKPDEVTRLAGAFMRGMSAAGMATTGKHFPGHGAVQEDSHLTLPVDDRPWADIAERDLAPFKLLLNQLDAVMPAHIIFSQIDDQPVGFSKHWLQQRLRKDLGFDGVIFSDDLSMEGAVQAGSYAERAEAALDAGCDMVLVCNNREGALEVAQSLENYEFSPKSRERLSRMLARRQWQWSDLQGDKQWQAGVKVAEEMLA